jgi:holin-like protein
MKKFWRATIQMLLLIIIYQLGNLITGFFHLQIPGNVIGIVILLGLLWSGVIKAEQIELAAGWLLKHLGFFFIPISIGLMTLGDIFVKNGFSILLVLVISAFIGLMAAGKVTQTLIEKEDKENVKYHDHVL